MKSFLRLRSSLISIYKNNEIILNMLAKFVISFICLLSVNSIVNFSGHGIQSIIVSVFIGLTSLILPMYVMLIVMMGLVILVASLSGLILSAVLSGIAAMIYILYIRLFKKEAVIIMLTILLLPTTGIYLVVLISPLFFGIGGIGAIFCGGILYHILKIMPTLINTAFNSGLKLDTIFAQIDVILTYILGRTIYDQRFLATMAILMVVFLVVYLIRIWTIDYALYIAVFCGAVTNILGFSVAQIMIDVDLNLPIMVGSTVICALVGFFVSFMSRVLDYNRAQVVQFEDDENYYFVKVIPKIELSPKRDNLYPYSAMETMDDDIIIEI
ncbi:MAG: hypothetical protein ATN31_03850 [Candidatus Epulonipiscioides saccharophilum]|nr:MAG: hypothetical protein ATN31_03850 [Epulopiscium sp. AS2M-Bin001]